VVIETCGATATAGATARLRRRFVQAKVRAKLERVTGRGDSLPADFLFVMGLGRRGRGTIGQKAPKRADGFADLNGGALFLGQIVAGVHKSILLFFRQVATIGAFLADGKTTVNGFHCDGGVRATVSVGVVPLGRSFRRAVVKVGDVFAFAFHGHNIAPRYTHVKRRRENF
jgi:hypothetical protein